MGVGNFPTYFVDGPEPIAPVHGLLPAAEAPAAGVRIIVDTTAGPVDYNELPDRSDLVNYTPPPNAGRERWLNGIAVWPYPPDTPDGWDACRTTQSPVQTKGFGTTVTPPTFSAFTISQNITCTSWQITDQEAFKARAVKVLTAVESWRCARELIANPENITGQPSLNDGLGTFPNGTVATRPNHGLQVLEGAIAATGRLGLIHCTPMLATALLGQGFVIKDVTGVIRTINGIPVIPDFGYVGVPGPTGKPAAASTTQEWAYATGPVDIRRSEIFTTPELLSQALERGVPSSASNSRPNTITYRAERYYAVDWDTALQAAVLIDRCETNCVTGS
jgi:hypothetical protein